jgi:Na+-driven multidrug efflux pump
MRGILLCCLLMIAVAAPRPGLAAQARLVTWQTPPAPRVPRASGPIVITQAGTPTYSTLAERFVGGFVVGGLAALAAAERYDDQPVAAAYALGSAAGVLLATFPRERPRTLPILLGTALGAVPLFALASAESSHPLSMPIFLVGVVATPLLGAAGQRW